MTIDRRLLAGALGLSLALAACGGATTASPAATAGEGTATGAPVEESEAPVATTEATEAPASAEPAETEVGADDTTGFELAPLTPLAALLPAQAGDVTFQRGGFDGDQLGMYGAMSGLDEDQLGPVLEKYGKTLSDVNFAIAAPDAGSGATAMIFALQVDGVEAAEAMSAMGLDASQMEKTTVGGKEVYAQGGGGFGVWAYPKDDVLFIVLLASKDVAASALEQLP